MLLTKFSTVIADGPCFGFIEMRVTRFGKESVSQNTARAIKLLVFYTV
jgi:hypothetical protein